MAPVYRIRNPDATFTDITSYFRLYTLDVATNAEEGSVAQSTITAHDPTGAFDIVGHRQIRIHENTASGSNTMIYVGFVGDRRISRGPNRTTLGADWEIDLLDPNSILARRILTGSDSNRPAETDVARIQWLVSTNESGMVNDSLYVQTVGPVNMDAKDYTGQRFNEVIDDCAQASGKNYHLWYRESTGTFSLWYDFDTSTSQTSPLRLTNVASEVDNSLTFAISDDTQLTRSPDRINSGVYLPYDGGIVYVQNGTTSNTYARRDVVMPAENVTTLTKATARATRYLTTMTTEEDVITSTVILPAEKVNFLTAGMRVQFKATHLPGYESFVWLRALNRSVLQVSEEFYAVKTELSPAPAVTCVGNPSLVQSAGLAEGGTNVTFVYPSVPTPGNLLTMIMEIRDAADSAGTASGWTAVPNANGLPANDTNGGHLYAFYRVCQAGDTASFVFETGNILKHLWGAEWCGVSTLEGSASKSNTASAAAETVGPATLTSAAGLAIGAVMSSGTGVAGGGSGPLISVDSPYTQAWMTDVGGMTNMSGSPAMTGPTYVVGYRFLTAAGATTLNVTKVVGGFATGNYAGVLMVFG